MKPVTSLKGVEYTLKFQFECTSGLEFRSHETLPWAQVKCLSIPTIDNSSLMLPVSPLFSFSTVFALVWALILSLGDLISFEFVTLALV